MRYIKIRIEFKPFILLAFILSASVNSYNQDLIKSEDVISLFNELYSFNFEKAKEEMMKIQAKDVNPDLKDICTANYCWWQIATRENYDSYRKEMLDALDRILMRHEKREIRQLIDDELFAITFAYAYKTRLDMHTGRYFKGIGNLKNTVKYLEAVMPKALDNEKFMLLAGLYHYIGGSLIKRHPILRPLFAIGPDPDNELGFSYLDKCAVNKHPLIRTEASYFMMRVKNEILDENSDADNIARKFLVEYPENQYFRSSRICILADEGREEDLKKELELLRISGSEPNSDQIQHEFILDETEKYLRKKRIKY